MLRSIASFTRRAGLCSLLLLAHCKDVSKVPATEVLVRIDASDEVKASLRSLRVRLSSSDGKAWSERGTETYPASKLRWPVDIPVIPRSADTQLFELVADALDAQSQPLVQARGITGFAKNELRVLSLRLELCGNRELGFVCESDTACVGESCKSCKDGTCQETRVTPVTELPAFTPAGSPHGVGVEGGLDDAPPSSLAAKVFDGAGPDDADYQTSTTTLVARWAGFSDDIGIARYEFKVAGQADCDGTPILGPQTLKPQTSMTADGLLLDQGMLFSCVRAGDTSGQFSAWVASDGMIIDSVAPRVEGTSPINMAAGGKRHELSIDFSEAIDPSSVTRSTVLVSANGTVVQGSFSFDATTGLVRFAPSSKLPMRASVRLEVTTGIRDLAGNALTADFVITFTAADGSWTTPVPFAELASGTPASQIFWQPFELKTDNRDHAYLAFEQGEGKASSIFVSRYASGTWSVPRAISTNEAGTFADQPRLAIDDQGNVRFAWRQAAAASDLRGVIWSAQLIAPDSWGEAERIDYTGGGPASGYDPHVAVDPLGSAWVTWIDQVGAPPSHRRIKGRRWSTNWAPAPTQLDGALVAGATNTRLSGDIAMTANGSAVVVFAEFDVAPISVSANFYTTANAWSGPTTLSRNIPSNAYIGSPPSVVSDAAGNFLAVWAHQPTTGMQFPPYHIMANYRSAASNTWTGQLQLEDDDTSNSSPRIAMNRAGVAVATWPHHAGTELGARRFAKGVWEPNLRTFITAAADPFPAIDEAGNSLIVFTERMNGVDVVRACRFTSAAIEAPVTLSSNSSMTARVAYLSNGDAIAVWLETAGARRRLMFARYE